MLRAPRNSNAGDGLRTDDVLEALYPLLLKHGSPDYFRSNNRPEFAAGTMQGWLRRVGIKSIRIYPASPWENGCNERFNGTLRREVLNAKWFTTTERALIVIHHRK
ncbi:integrase core domain-containing protein [uncultured Tateyamaria sp.]|uniref:integrase core domain-containing protein n=1 Tax=uncultured Tateyamaria sp. TaxID=455651 RepID=UPI00261C3040|nr:integrase core domain-containing protein [uncultured Tateyamaria sp.]